MANFKFPTSLLVHAALESVAEPVLPVLVSAPVAVPVPATTMQYTYPSPSPVEVRRSYITHPMPHFEINHHYTNGSI